MLQIGKAIAIVKYTILNYYETDGVLSTNFMRFGVMSVKLIQTK